MWVWLVVGWMACVPIVLLLIVGDDVAQYIRYRLRVERVGSTRSEAPVTNSPDPPRSLPHRPSPAHRVLRVDQLEPLGRGLVAIGQPALGGARRSSG